MDTLYKHIPFYIRLSRTTKKAVGLFYHNFYESVFNMGKEKSNYWPRYTYWQADGNVEAQAVRVLVYGSDIYVMTLEHNLDTDAWCTRVWMNHTLKGTVNGIIGNAFVVI